MINQHNVKFVTWMSNFGLQHILSYIVTLLHFEFFGNKDDLLVFVIGLHT